MFCTNCGSQCADDQKFCPSCGQSLSPASGSANGASTGAAPQANNNPQPAAYNPQPSPAPGNYNFNNNMNTPGVVDSGGFGWGLLGCCIPIVGLILFLVWKDNKPCTAKAAGVGALVGVICFVVFYILIFGMLGAATTGMY